MDLFVLHGFLLFSVRYSSSFGFPAEHVNESFAGLEILLDCKGYTQSCIVSCQQNTDYPPKETPNTRLCHCDDLCPVFGDCCVNYFACCHNLKHYDDIIQFLYGVKSKSRSQLPLYTDVRRVVQYSSCLNIDDGKVAITIYMISKCPVETVDEHIRQSCEDKGSAFPFDIPVTNRWNMHEVFANIFCALCHNIPRRDMIVWDSELRCKEPLGNISKSHHRLETLVSECTTYVVYHNSSKARMCQPQQPSPSCEYTKYSSIQLPTGQFASVDELDLLCQSYLLPVESALTHGQFRNVHCLTCETGSRLRKDELLCLFNTINNIHHNTNSYIKYSFHISVNNMSYRLVRDDDIVLNPTLECSKNQTANSLLKRCEENSHCLTETVYVPGRGCFTLFDNRPNTNLIYKTSLFLHAKFDMFSKPNFTNVVAEIETSVVEVMEKVVSTYGLSDKATELHVSSVTEYLNWNEKIEATSSVFENASSALAISHMTYKSMMRVFTDEALSDIMTILQITFLQLSRFSSSSIYAVEMVLSSVNDIASVVCPSGRKTVLKNIPLFRFEGKIYAMFEPSKMLVNLKNSTFSVIFTTEYGLMHLQSLVLCLSGHDEQHFIGHSYVREMNCPTVSFKDSEYTIDEDHRLLLIESDHAVQKGKYVINGREAWVCEDTVKQFLNQSKTYLDFRVFKTVSLIICGTCILTILLIKLKQKDYQENDSKLVLGGVCCMLVVFTLDTSDGLLESVNVRLSVSAVMHFTWLLIVCLQTVRAHSLIQWSRGDFHQHSAIKYENAVSVRTGRYYFAIAVCVLTAGVVVVTCIILETRSTLGIIYGQGSVVWWMGNWVALLVSYVLPAGLLELVGSWCSFYGLLYGRKGATTWRCRQQCLTALISCLLVVLLTSCGLSAEYTGHPVLGYLYYTLHLTIALFLFYTMTVTHLVSGTYTLACEDQEPVIKTFTRASEYPSQPVAIMSGTNI